MMEFDVDPDDICSCMVPWITLHDFIILPSANRSVKRRKIIRNLAEYKQKYEKGRGEQYWRSHIDKCPILDRVMYLKNLQTPKEKPKHDGVIGADMVSLRPIKPPKESAEKFVGKLRNSKAVIQAALKNFLKKRTPGEKMNLKSFKEAYNLPFDEQVIDAELNEILMDDSIAEYFSTHDVSKRETESIRPTKKRRLQENHTQVSSGDEILLNQGTINERDGAENEPFCSVVTSVLEEKSSFPPEEKTHPKSSETTEYFLPSPISEEETSSPLTLDEIDVSLNKKELHDEPVENSILAEDQAVGVPYQSVEIVNLEDREERVEEPVRAPAEFLLPVDFVDTPTESVCLESHSLVDVEESPEEAIVEDSSFCLSEYEDEMMALEKRAEIQSANLKNIATDGDVNLPPTPPHTYDLIPSESKEPLGNLDDSGIFLSARESLTHFPYVLETFNAPNLGEDIISSTLNEEGCETNTHTFSQKPIEYFDNTLSHVNLNYSESCSLIPKPSIPKRIIFSPSTDIFHIMGKTIAETMYDPDIQPNQNILPVDWENYFN